MAQADRPAPLPSQDAQSFERPQLETDYIAPRNPVEQKLADLFASLLGVSEVGIEDSFFDLGGHSLIAVRLFAQVKRQFDVEFPLSVLFEAPSVAALSDRIIARRGGGIAAEPATARKTPQSSRNIPTSCSCTPVTAPVGAPSFWSRACSATF